MPCPAQPGVALRVRVRVLLLVLRVPVLSVAARSGVAALAFLVRDLGVIAFFRFGPRAGRGDFGAVLGLFLLYFAGVALGRTLLGEEGGAIFMPVVSHAPVSLASGLVQAAVVWILAWGRIRAPEVRA